MTTKELMQLRLSILQTLSGQTLRSLSGQTVYPENLVAEAEKWYEWITNPYKNKA